MTALSDDLLERRLAERASAGSAPALGTIARTVAVSPRRRSAPWAGRRPILGSIAACAIVALALVGGLLNRVGPSLGGPSALAIQPGGSASALASRSTQAPSELTAWTAIEWRRLSSTEFPEVKTARVSDAVAFGDGFVAVGSSGSVGRIWQSTDAMTWSTVDGEWLKEFDPERVVTVGDRLAIFGRRNGAAGGVAQGLEMWTSRDGAEWVQGPPTPVGSGRPAALPARNPPAITAGPLGVLARGDAFTFLLAPDLTTWTDVTPTWPADVRVGPLAGGDRIWIQPGATGVAERGSSMGAIWTSTDGRTWTKATIDDPAGVVLGAYQVAGGYVAIGSRANVGCEACFGPIVIARVAWFSADGSHWTRMAGSAGEGDDRIFGASFAGDGRRLLAFTDAIPRDTGTAPPVPVVSETIDGRSWTSVEVGSTGALPTQLNEGLTVGQHGVIELPGSILDRESGPAAWWGQAVEAP